MKRRQGIQGLAVGGLGGLAGLWGLIPCSVAAQDVPAVLQANRVVARAGDYRGRAALALELTDAEQRRVNAGSGGNAPTLATVRADFGDGVIEADVAAELTGRGDPESRGFVGLAFRVSSDFEQFEAVYLRGTNGRLNEPPPPAPRIDRAIQYVAHPDFHFDVSRKRFPGRYERGAAIALGRWHRLRLEIAGANCRAFIDDQLALEVTDLRLAGRRGAVALWIDDGTRGWFSGVRVRAAG